jgi:4'-phosphopantetheinyl transferase EntD
MRVISVTASDALDASLGAIFPPGVRWAVLTEPPADFALLPEEQDFTRHLVAKRFREFVLGRACARSALVSLGAGGKAIPTGPNREPVWPPGVVGSITHVRGLAAAVVGRQETFASLGLDIESAAPLEAELVARICRPDEISRMSPPGELPALAKRSFSIKESIYKCLWPLLREFLDFGDIEIVYERQAAAFTAVSHTPKCPAELIARLQGRFVRCGDYLAAASTILQPPVQR